MNYGYVCFYNGKRFECHADSLYGAKKLAIQHFKPPKSKEHMVTATLAEKNSQPVFHAAVD